MMLLEVFVCVRCSVMRNMEQNNATHFIDMGREI